MGRGITTRDLAQGTRRAWSDAFATRVANDQGHQRPFRVLWVPSRDRLWGGRWFPDAHTVVCFETGDQEFDRAVLIHEIGHDLRSHAGDRDGHHDAPFFALVERLYRRYGVSIETARRVEDHGYPEAWNRSQW